MPVVTQLRGMTKLIANWIHQPLFRIVMCQAGPVEEEESSDSEEDDVEQVASRE